MHFAERAYFLIVASALLAIAGLWSSDPTLAVLWRWPASFLLLGLAGEALFIRHVVLRADVDTAARAVLGREQSAAFTFRNESARALTIEFAPLTPAGFEPLPATRSLSVPAAGSARDAFTLLPVRLGAQSWPRLPVRCLGPAGLAWWSRELAVARRIAVAPDALRLNRARPRGRLSGLRSRRSLGAGSELYQLRAYAPGDPLARVDWKATARSGQLMTREFSEDQHLDILIAVDAGRFSRVRAGRLDRFGVYANIAARFAQVATPNDDRVGLVVFADRILAVCAPERGLRAITRLHATLTRISAQASESDPVNAALAIRTLLKHRSLVIVLTDLEDTEAAAPLARAVRLVSPPHLVVVAGVASAEIAALARRAARGWRDPWVALAALEQQSRAAAQRLHLQRLGTPVIAAAEDRLQEAIFSEYERLRRRRRV
ncbi:MAG TPA: DUF58 domain-containing protein [Steroidobacteraceae bacterium]|jgi:uncharacterized protein (DUF58 family)|nr:DUF58 domain-containing protein [Steroidobacteraceae bacterium]